LDIRHEALAMREKPKGNGDRGMDQMIEKAITKNQVNRSFFFFFFFFWTTKEER
jgi:hypothetical protein